MIQGTQIFNFVDRKVGVTQDGEKYLALNVLSKDNQKLSFITKKEELINKISSLQLTKFQDIKLNFNFSREFNREKRVSYWACELIGVGN